MKYSISIFILFLLVATNVFTQDIQLPMDNEGKVLLVDDELNNRLKLFTDYQGFREAKLFQISDNEFVLEIYYKTDTNILRKRITYTMEQVRELRSKISAEMSGQVSVQELEQGGRVKLLVVSTVAGISYYGWAIPVALDMQSGKAIASTYMFTSAISFFVPFAATRNSKVTEASANSYLYGTTRGIIHGLTVNTILTGSDAPYRRTLAFSMAGSLTEGIALYKLSSSKNWSTGKAELIGVGGDFGLLTGLTAPIIVNKEGGRAQAASALVGSICGFAAGNYLSGREHYTQGDAFVLRGGGTMGAYTALSAVHLSETENENIYAGAFIIGSAGGLLLGNRLVMGKDFTPAQGTFIELGQLAGWLTGLGIAYLIKDPASNDSRLFMSMSAIGGAAGYTFMYRNFADKAQKKASKTSWNIQLTPQNLLVAKFNRSDSGSAIPMPIAALNVSF